MAQTPLLKDGSIGSPLAWRISPEDCHSAGGNVSLTICSLVLSGQMAELSLTDCHRVQNTFHACTGWAKNWTIFWKFVTPVYVHIE